MNDHSPSHRHILQDQVVEDRAGRLDSFFGISKGQSTYPNPQNSGP